MKRPALAILTALLLVTAGCTAGPASGGTTTAPTADGDATGDATGDGTGDATADGDTDSVAGPSGTVSFYVSDRPGAMDDFRHLNVTITEVRFHLVDAADSAAENGTSNATSTTTATATGNATMTTTATATPTATATTTAAAGTATETPATLTARPQNETADGAESEREAEGEDEAEEEAEDGDGRWVVRDVNATTVDLTRLQGDNATLVEQFDVPAGEYDKVFLMISDVNATLTDGTDQRVKLPSGKLQLNTQFTVSESADVEFVYDIMVHKAGKSGKYILRPVVSQSGTDVPIDPVDRKGRPVDDDGDETGESDDKRDDAREDRSESLQAEFLGPVKAGENVTVRVTHNGSAVANATVSYGSGEGTTNADGEYVIAVPADAEELEVTIEYGDAETELERKLTGGQGNGKGQGNDPGKGNG